ncbi:MAG: sulfatase [Candidatus Sumerlaeota bacterium]|nr:sulfatase [Candidatus Sumerlaeota bacterium]
MMPLHRREFLKRASCAAAALAAPCWLRPAETAGPKLNILLFTADDLNWDSPGTYGCKIRDLTPNIDRLATEGMKFMHAYSTVAVCQPVRGTMSTGLYPHHSGCRGFEPINDNVTTLNEILHHAGYIISMMGKNAHYMPHEKFCIDYERKAPELGQGRDPEKYHEFTREFLELARKRGAPFFHHVNCQDPHRPFADSEIEKNSWPQNTPATRRVIKPEEVEVPKFLEELPEVRREVAQYFTSVHRLDETVGAVMGALKESGFEDKTLVLFYGGDHGMSFPFSKSNNYETSNHGGLIVRWPGAVKPGSVDDRHFVATIDFMPTLIEAAGLPPVAGLDGRSFVPALRSQQQEDRDRVYTVYYETSGRNAYPMRCVRTQTHAYIFNAWSDGQYAYKAENMAGLSWPAMQQAAQTNPEIARRVDFYLHRAPEELYDLTGDIAERKNLINDPASRNLAEAMRKDMQSWLERVGDPLLEIYRNRNSAEYMQRYHNGINDGKVPKQKNAARKAQAVKAAGGGGEDN